MKTHVNERIAHAYGVRPRVRKEPEERPRQKIQELVRPRVDAPLDDDEVVQRRHERPVECRQIASVWREVEMVD